VVGGPGREGVHGDADLKRDITDAVVVSNDSPVLLDRFLDNAVEVDVDVVADAEGNVLIGGIMEHIEEAGVHSGDSSCSLPPYSLPAAVQDALRKQVAQMARELKVIGLMNTQFAIQTDDRGKATIFLLEVNPRASRTAPCPRRPAWRWRRLRRAAWWANLGRGATREVADYYRSRKGSSRS
jgi:carbamoyl-phosphate synthase large subunit